MGLPDVEFRREGPLKVDSVEKGGLEVKRSV
jgi:hypothetical protein